MKSSPIFNIIHNNSRKSDCSFGAYDGFTQIVRVGTSASNSHELAFIDVQRTVDADGRAEFTLSIDSKLCARGILNGKEFTSTMCRSVSDHV